MIRAVPGRDGVARGRLAAGSAVARAVGEGPRGGALEVTAYRASPGDPGGAGPRPRAHGVLAEVVLSLQLAPPRQRRPARLEDGRQRRRISRFSPASGQIVARGQELGQQPRCEVELTEAHTSGSPASLVMIGPVPELAGRVRFPDTGQGCGYHARAGRRSRCRTQETIRFPQPAISDQVIGHERTGRAHRRWP
jgi:hypothetical protein